MVTKSNPRTISILVVEDDPVVQKIMVLTLSKAGFTSIVASNGVEALMHVKVALPDLIVSDVMMPKMDGFEMLKALRSDPKTSFIPVIMLTSRDSCEDIIDGLDMGADDYLPKPFDPDILIARIRSKINRPPIPVENLIIDRQTGLLSVQNFQSEAKRELFRAARSGKTGCLAYCELNEMPRLKERLGDRANREISEQVSIVLQETSHPLDIFGHDPSGKFLILIPETDQNECKKYLNELSDNLSSLNFFADAESVRLTPIIGFTLFEKEKGFEEVDEKTQIALEYARSQMDLEPKIYNDEAKRTVEKIRQTTQHIRSLSPISQFFQDTRTLFQFLITTVMYMVIPFLMYWFLDRIGADITPVVYYIIVVALLMTAIVIWIEGFLSLKEKHPPEIPGLEYPQASAIIAAYMPNEAYTILDTIKHFLELDYPNNLQIILAYNTPKPLPVEKTLQQLAKKDPRLMLLKVEGSESKSQNVNAAIAHVTGEFVGIFDADHHPQKDAFMRAWRWLAESCDIVQGHCLVRNHDASFISRMVAVEFEAIYAVSHPGRTRLYGFGIFGGSNGFWKTELLRQTRMHGFMLTEDIDSSMRVTEEGAIIVTDPLLVSRELAPGTIKALWHQRMRWAQGWFQVSLEHFMNAIRSKRLTPRQKLGAVYLLVWRELYPWISAQMFPIIAFWAVKYNGLDELDWLIPVFILTSLFTLSVGPGQALFAYLKSEKEIKEHKGWFWQYLLFSSIFYTEFKNVIARIAQIKEIMGERSWRITPRTNKP
ncbi:MAG: histidine kinase [Chloroflexi bacterium HGW-Chloroflexi-5]|jgi:CheY-like chemotaxis protein/cellulose synthase/poly-beta-1,6-N-acetylglucosamine synthase-like glycosyltransferase|nr:MAG: histidine kinase [Chloroflexi bacterium HGW-Chloroflexi-5]